MHPLIKHVKMDLPVISYSLDILYIVFEVLLSILQCSVVVIQQQYGIELLDMKCVCL